MERGKTLYVTEDEVIRVVSNWRAQAEKRGETVESSEWETTSGTVADDALVDYAAEVFLTVSGCGTLKNTVTLGNGEVLIRVWRIEAAN